MQESEALDIPPPDAFMVRPALARTYRPSRQRRHPRLKEQERPRSVPLVEDTMDGDNVIEPAESSSQVEGIIDRTSLCLPHFEEDAILHGGDDGFKHVLQKYFPTPESNATERLVALKSKLKMASTYDFWRLLMEEMCDIMDAQCGFVAKRILVDDQVSAIEMPEYGQPGSCLMGVAFYLNNGEDVNELHRDYRYHAYGTPCEHMKHDKVFIVPERLSEFTPNNPNTLPWKQSEAFIGVPLFADGKCFAHFGMTWSSEGASKRKLSWSFIEMFMHSLEDMILQRILDGRGFVKAADSPDSTTAKIIPLAAITASQSLKPYARSLSHELRTPMQGVVGMLDIMYSTVLDAINNQPSEIVREVFNDLKGHIEIVQDSSKRAVEAADNVVHAYDLNMQMPETPLTPVGSDIDVAILQQSHVDFSEGLVSLTSKKRKRTEDNFHPGPPLKRMYTITEAEMLRAYELNSNSQYANSLVEKTPSDAGSDSAVLGKDPIIISLPLISTTQKRIITRDFIRSLVTECLRSGHPVEEVHTETELGETIAVKTIGDRGQAQNRTVRINIDLDVPEAVVTEEQYLHFSIQKVVDNAIKFTESGSITVSVKMSKGTHVLEIWVVDTGCGISEESKLSLFKPHFQEDASRNRTRDGLGLSLFNAKAHVRRNLGGDVTLERSSTEGLSKGSEFLIRLPIFSSNNNTPLIGTPTPGQPPYLSQDTNSFSSYFPRPSTPIREPSPPKQSPRKHKLFNRNLATSYPLNILIAEDNQINRNVALGCLQKLGYPKSSITLAFDGVEAVRKYASSILSSDNPENQGFDAILMDIWMPNMDGYEATTKILELARKNGKRTKIIAVTADITRESLERAKEVGMQGFLAKPYKVLDIENLIVEHYGKS